LQTLKPAKVPDQRCDAPLRCALHRIRETQVQRQRVAGLNRRCALPINVTLRKIEEPEPCPATQFRGVLL
jgi:hypothetical protein